MDLVISLNELQTARLALLGGSEWARQLFDMLLAVPQPFALAREAGTAPPPDAALRLVADNTAAILTHAEGLTHLFRGSNSKVKGNAGETAYLNILNTAFPKLCFDERAAREGRAGDIRATFPDGGQILIEAKMRVGNVPKAEVDAFHAHMRASRMHGIMLNAEGGVVHRPHRFNVDLIPADDRQLVAVYLPNNGGDMDTVGLAFNLIRKMKPALDALQGNELVFSLDLCEEVNKIIAAKCKALRAVQASNRGIAALVEKQTREIEASTLDDVSTIFSAACAKVKTLTPAQLPLRLTAEDLL